MQQRHHAIAIGVALAASGLGCRVAQEAPPATEAPATITRAIAVLHATEGNEVRGTVRFERTPDGIQVMADVSGLVAGDHGFHIHQLGDCSAPDATSSGGHFNPEAVAHGGPLADERHVGDLGNLTADSTGAATYQRIDSVIALRGSHSVIGRAVIVHAGADDLTSQPTGAAGARLACGVIGIAQ